MKKWRLYLFTVILLPTITYAGLDSFEDGPVIKTFGKQHTVDPISFSAGQQFKVSFDVAEVAENGVVNRKFDSLARFINMHVAHGVKPENIQLALVVHGKASMEMLDHATFRMAYGKDNANKPLLTELMKNNVRIILCGQSAAAYDIQQEQVIEGVEIALSAMTAHALLQQQGYTLNPF